MDLHFEEFIIPSLRDFIDRDKEEILLCSAGPVVAGQQVLYLQHAAVILFLILVKGFYFIVLTVRCNSTLSGYYYFFRCLSVFYPFRGLRPKVM